MDAATAEIIHVLKAATAKITQIGLQSKTGVITARLTKGTIMYLGAARTDGYLQRKIVCGVHTMSELRLENFLKDVCRTNPLQPAQAIIWK